jgi:colicin import membrane protein
VCRAWAWLFAPTELEALNASVAPASNSPSAQTDFLRPKGADGWRQGLVWALAAHGLLLLALMLNMSWRTQPVEVVEAEIWAQVPRAAQPSARVMPPPPAPAPTPAPEPALPPAPLAQPKPAPEPAPKPADVSVERKPKDEPKKPKPPKEYFEADPPKLKKRLEEAKTKPEPKPAPKPEPKQEPKPEPKPPKAEVKPAPRPAPAPATVNAQASAQQEKERQERIKRMMADLGGEGTPSAGPSADYAGRIKARIKPNVVFTEEVSGNPVASVEVNCAPDGRIIGRRLITRSGNTAWDDAVLRAIDRTEVLPLNEKGRVPSVMQISFRPRDF